MSVLSKPEMKGSFNHLLIGLSSFDFLYLIFSLLLFGLPQLSEAWTLSVYPYIMPIGFGFVHITRVGSVLMTLSVTIERFFAIVYPLRRRSLTGPLIIASCIFSVVYNLPRFAEFEMTHINVTDHLNQTIERVQVVPTSLRINSLYVQIYVVWMKLFIIELIPYITILVLNTIMIINIRSSAKKQQEMTLQIRENTKKETNMALVLVCIVIVFIVCQSIKIVPDLWEALISDQQQYSIEVFISVSVVSMAINSASNFGIYMLRGNKFRRVAKKTIRSWFRLKSDDGLTSNGTMRYRYTSRRHFEAGSCGGVRAGSMAVGRTGSNGAAGVEADNATGGGSSSCCGGGGSSGGAGSGNNLSMSLKSTVTIQSIPLSHFSSVHRNGHAAATAIRSNSSSNGSGGHNVENGGNINVG